MKILFGSPECFYAGGGAHDLLAVDKNIHKLFRKIGILSERHWDEKEQRYIEPLQWWHIYHIKKNQIIAASDKQPYPPGVGNSNWIEMCVNENLKNISFYTYTNNAWRLMYEHKQKGKQ